MIVVQFMFKMLSMPKKESLVVVIHPVENPEPHD